ncbi:glycoside hydrolase family 10 protein [[Clostridium] polysaccharolyticum]|uniref:Uncharacterized lipoprotein YddW, UPF0748 family n=1 Tax=[Clostridium] polysaccharolyticum TaxID=29364 RepID=A0A1I0A8A1_9FIRM|nr:family 10 glycosylhydrolase [[Clostridium] polysaccharolyticum]SES90394.1 Uncharacterized lipoprotein YddW, UPF0748 family [[Clostridium] polysaccharolyticum]
MKSYRQYGRIRVMVLVLVFLCMVMEPVMGIGAKKISNSTENSQAVNKNELRGVWISYLEFANAQVSKMSKSTFCSYIDTMFDKCKELKMNTVVVQVRPSGDAMYPSKYYPWSSYISGEQGKALAYDPLSYMVASAHRRGLRFYAWVNPYRVSAVSTDITKLAVDNQARKWRTSKDKGLKRNVLTYHNQLYYNPAKNEVRTLIVNGVKEIVRNYAVDGIVFDDYFYPDLGQSYKSNFDAVEYKNYCAACKQKGKTYKSITEWRRSNVSGLLKRVKSASKAIRKSVQFGVSPQGNIDNLYLSNANYCDVKRWMKSSGFIDFICPQIYWSTSNPSRPYNKAVEEWASFKTNKVKFYVALAVYKAGLSKQEASRLSPADMRWCKADTNLKEQVVNGRKIGKAEGFMFYRYDNLVSSKACSEKKNLLSVL